MLLSQVNIKPNPEHPTLAGYLSDNPSPPCPIVGLEHISEYWGGEDGVGEVRPYYHCSQEECYNEQGNSRQMMQHLIRRHHVEGWLKEREGRLPNTHQDVVFRCRQLFHSGDIKCDVKMVKVFTSKELWEKCKKARLRLNTKQAEELYKKETLKKVVEKPPESNITAAVAYIPAFKRKEEIACKICRLMFPDEDAQLTRHYVDKHFLGPLEQRFFTHLKYDLPLTCPLCPHTTVKQAGNPLAVHKRQLLYHLGLDHCVVEKLLRTSQSIATCLLPQTEGKAALELGEALHSISARDVLLPTESAKEVTVDKTSEQLVDLFQEAVVATPTTVAVDVVNTVDTIPALSTADEDDVSLSTLNISDIDPKTAIETTAVTTKTMTVNEEKEVCNNTDSLKTITNVAIDHSPSEGQSNTAAQEETIDLTGQTQKKLSLKEYQEKLRKEKIGNTVQQDVKPFDDEDEIEVVGYKEGNVKASKNDFHAEPPVKKEKSSGSQFKDLLERRSSGDVLVECAVKGPPKPQFKPMFIFRHKVIDCVKRHLLNYYAKDANDTKDKQGKVKVIKIRNNKEFESYCKTYSKKFQADIYEAYTSINGTDEGIEHDDVNQYGIDHDIEKFFSEINI